VHQCSVYEVYDKSATDSFHLATARFAADSNHKLDQLAFLFLLAKTAFFNDITNYYIIIT